MRGPEIEIEPAHIDGLYLESDSGSANLYSTFYDANNDLANQNTAAAMSLSDASQPQQWNFFMKNWWKLAFAAIAASGGTLLAVNLEKIADSYKEITDVYEIIADDTAKEMATASEAVS